MSVEYELAIEATVKKSGAYFGTKESLDWFLSHANDDTRYLRVFIQEGATEPKEVHAKIRVKRIILVPEREPESS